MWIATRGFQMLSFLISLIGFIFGYRQIEKISLKIGQTLLQKLFFHSIFSMCLIFGTIFFFGTPHFLWIFQGITMLSIFWTPKLIIYYSKRRLMQNFSRFLDQMILNMQSGTAFRRSFQQLIHFESGFMKVQLQEILNHIIYPTNANLISDRELRQIVLEFVEIDQMSAKSLDHLKSFRQLCRLQLEFQRKESQIKESVRVQSVILVLLYVALFVFVATRFGFQENSRIFLFSGSLLGIGLIVLQLIGGHRRWKV